MEMQTNSYKCPNCSGELVWNADKQLYSCEWCSSDFSEKEVIQYKPQEPTHEDEAFNGDTDLYICQSCGAEIFCDHNTAATFCFYCHNPVQLKGRLEGSFKPDKIIPFKISKDSAKEKFTKLIKAKKFLPFGFTDESTLEKMTGLYVPFWIADPDIDVHMEGRSTESHSRRSGDTTYVTEHIYRHERSARMRYKGVPADGSKKIDDALMDAVEPFDYTELRDFDMSYLSGFFCDKYDVDKAEVMPRIKARVEKSAEAIILNDMSGHGAVTVTQRDIRFLATHWRYMMLPVWFFTYKYRGKMYGFALNGQTGKLVGRYPVSIGKLFILAAAVTLIVGSAVLLLMEA
ncbi:MAG: hypothetical protein J6I96_00635 [Oscillospiraceae bacterium]|nr:hypothetical protein [Oscillospiraceae bacterium]